MNRILDSNEAVNLYLMYSDRVALRYNPRRERDYEMMVYWFCRVVWNER